jgi:hypothetical protein
VLLLCVVVQCEFAMQPHQQYASLHGAEGDFVQAVAGRQAVCRLKTSRCCLPSLQVRLFRDTMFSLFLVSWQA